MADNAGEARRLAAVVMPIYANPPHEVVFVERARHLRRHAGQIAFPGGALDAEDAGDLSRTAVRELEEELGIPPTALTLIDRLETIRQQRNIFNVTTYVGVVAPGTPLVIDYNEAAAAFRVPLAAILEPGAVHRGEHVADGVRIATTIFDYGDLHVWGLTAGMLAAFVRRYHAPDSALRAALEGRLLR